MAEFRDPWRHSPWLQNLAPARPEPTPSDNSWVVAVVDLLQLFVILAA